MKRLVFICCICLAAIASQHTATARSHQQSDESAGLTDSSIHAPEEASAQPVVRYSRPIKAAFKTNLLYDATATVNLGVEFAVAPKLTIDISGNFHPWILPGGRRLTHLLVQPELRWWIKERFKGHFVAFNVLAADYNAGNIPNNITIMGRSLSALGRYRLDGKAFGAGVAYGYAFRVGKRLNIELEAGLGYISSKFDAYRLDADESLYAENSTVQYFGPTKGALNIVYLF